MMSCSRKVMAAENAEHFPPSQQKTFRLTPFDEADRIPHMAETIHDRIRKQLNSLDLTPQAASLRAGMSKDALRKLLANPDQLPQGKTLSKLADALQTTEQWLLRGDDAASGNTSSRGTDASPADVRYPFPAEMPRDLPVYGTAAGSHARGAFQMDTSNVIDWVRRPPALSGSKDAYSLFVEGSSMEPKYRAGDLCFVHPHKPTRSGDYVVVQLKQGEHEPFEATIGILRRRSTSTVVLGKLNPEMDIELENVLAVHRIMEMHELFGI